MAVMTEFRVVWADRNNRKAEKVLFVEAANSIDAAEVAREYVERKFAVAHVLIASVKVATVPTPGQVLESARSKAQPAFRKH